jgi:DNA-binding response OmpR family regulator
MDPIAVIKGKAILLVEDEPDLREILAEEFSSISATIYQAANIKDAFAIAETTALDVIISDIRMPGGTGVELMQNIKTAALAKQPLFCLISGYSDIPDEVSYDLGVEVCFAKPFNLGALVLAISRSLCEIDQRWLPTKSPHVGAQELSINAPNITVARDSHIVNFGRGGLFVAIKGNFPTVGRTIRLRIKLGPALPLDIIGVCRWVRSADTIDLCAGIGIEFVEICQETRKLLKALFAQQEVMAFIPRS